MTLGSVEYELAYHQNYFNSFFFFQQAVDTPDLSTASLSFPCLSSMSLAGQVNLFLSESVSLTTPNPNIHGRKIMLLQLFAGFPTWEPFLLPGKLMMSVFPRIPHTGL